MGAGCLVLALSVERAQRLRPPAPEYPRLPRRASPASLPLRCRGLDRAGFLIRCSTGRTDVGTDIRTDFRRRGPFASLEPALPRPRDPGAQLRHSRSHAPDSRPTQARDRAQESTVRAHVSSSVRPSHAPSRAADQPFEPVSSPQAATSTAPSSTRPCALAPAPSIVPKLPSHLSSPAVPSTRRRCRRN